MRFTRFFIAGLGILSLSCITTEGSVIIQQLNSAADLDLSGNIIYAVNFGNNGSPIIGGVVFSQDQDYPAITTGVLSGETGVHWWGPSPGTADAGLNQLMDSLAYRYAPPSEMLINAGGLNPGTPYLLQIIVYEPEDHGRNIDITVEGNEIVTGFNPIVEQGGVVGQGGSVIKYDFIAGDPILNIRMLSHEDAVGLSGFMLTVIPEPATVTLLGLGGLALLRRGRLRTGPN